MTHEHARAGLGHFPEGSVPFRKHRLVCNVRHTKRAWATLVATEAVLIALYLFAFADNKAFLVVVFFVACVFVFHPVCFLIEWRLRRDLKRQGL